MRRIKFARVFSLWLSILASLYMHTAQAANGCTYSSLTQTITLASAAPITNDLPIGSLLASGTGTLNITCNTTPNSRLFGASIYNEPLPVTTVTYNTNGLNCKVLQTGIIGVGIVWVNYSSNAGTTQCTSDSNLNSGGTGQSGPRGLNITNGNNTLNDYFYLVKTADIENDTYISSITINTALFDAGRAQLESLTSIILNINLTIRVPSCTVANDHIEVNLGRTYKNYFNGIGSSSRESSFDIGISCLQTGITPTITFSGNVADAPNGLIAIDNVPNAASGVAVQLLRNSQPVSLNTPLQLDTIPAFSKNYTFGARYYQMGDITPGEANANATFVLTYE